MFFEGVWNDTVVSAGGGAGLTVGGDDGRTVGVGLAEGLEPAPV